MQKKKRLFENILSPLCFAFCQIWYYQDPTSIIWQAAKPNTPSQVPKNKKEHVVGKRLTDVLWKSAPDEAAKTIISSLLLKSQ